MSNYFAHPIAVIRIITTFAREKSKTLTLPHGVMVAQQILVLFVKVRVLMRQQ